MTHQEFCQMLFKAVQLGRPNDDYYKTVTVHEQSQRMKIEELTEELAFYKKMYGIRGEALKRPCSHCGKDPIRVRALAETEETHDASEIKEAP